MSASDNLEAIWAAPFGDALDALDALMAQHGRVFLIGAGCSKCAGLPLMEELTAKVLDSGVLDADTTAILKGIQVSFTGASGPNIEDYLSEIIDLLAIAERRSERGATDNQVFIKDKQYSGQQLRESAEKIKRTISDIIECRDKKIDVAVHREFVKAVHRPIRPGKQTALVAWIISASTTTRFLKIPSRLREFLSQMVWMAESPDGGTLQFLSVTGSRRGSSNCTAP